MSDRDIHSSVRRSAWATALLALLCGCANVRTVSLEVRDLNGAPVRGAHVMAVRLESGGVPLPLEGATIQELLATGKTGEQGWTDERGVARLRLMAGRPHLVQAHPPMFSQDAGGEPARYRLDPSGSTLTPVEAGASWSGGMRIVP